MADQQGDTNAKEEETDVVVVADDQTIVEDIPTKETVIVDPTVSEPTERILAAKIQTVEELLTKINSNQTVIMERLAKLDARLSIDAITTDVSNSYDEALKAFLNK